MSVDYIGFLKHTGGNIIPIMQDRKSNMNIKLKMRLYRVIRSLAALEVSCWLLVGGMEKRIRNFWIRGGHIRAAIGPTFRFQ